MEDIKLDQVIEITDTPERAAARHINGLQFGKESNSSLAGHQKKSDLKDEKSLNPLCASRDRVLSENEFGRRLHLHSQRSPINIDDYDPQCISSSKNSALHVNAPLFRRAAIVNNSKPENRHSKEGKVADKWKAIHGAMYSKKPVQEDSFLNLTEKNEHDRIFEIGFPRGGSKDPGAKETREGGISSSGSTSLRLPPPSRISAHASKGKEKVDVNAGNGSVSASNNGKATDVASGSRHKIEKQSPACHLSVSSSRITGQKRFVRNGCISPHNIATRAQKLAERLGDGSSNKEKDHARNMVSVGPSNVGIREIVGEDNDSYGAKGKKEIIRPPSSKKFDANITNSGTRGCRGASLGGWRSTHSRSNAKGHLLPDKDGQLLGRDDDSRCSLDEQHDTRAVKRDNQSGGELLHVGDVPAKRRRTHGIASRNQGECSTMVHEDSEILFLGSSGESSSSRTSRFHNLQHEGVLETTYEINDLSTEMRKNESQIIGSGSNEDSVARARQVEADEVLARELQEQLYHEEPIFGGGEIDANIAWALQQEEGTVPAASSQIRHVSHLRNSSNAHSPRQHQPRSSQNPSNRRGTQVRAANTRMSGLRNRLLNRTPVRISRNRNPFPAAFPGGLNFQFPLGMDLDVRLDILENLEASMTASHMLQAQRDFNANDYEMLLALDENNSHRGASAHQINSLPESVVQTDNLEESCAICLEAPTVGEKIRHLPCLHKFHKDCIDPWLSRNTSCPVCKSSITC